MSNGTHSLEKRAAIPLGNPNVDAMNVTPVAVSSSPLRRLYNKMIQNANSPKAVWILALTSFTESSFSPLPPDLMLIPMILANRTKAWRLAFICTAFSVLGGVLGYAIGYFLFGTIGEWIIQTYQYQDSFKGFQETFRIWGFWIIVLKGLTPIPFKLVTIASGVAGLNFFTFMVASIIARSFRFFLVAGLLHYCGDWARQFIEKYLPWVFGGMLFILIGGFVAVKLLLG
jgi:membrane protein YqaA with SNARE-associated domain